MDTLLGRPRLSLKSLTSFSNLTPQMRTHMKKVYIDLTLCMLAASVGGFFACTRSWPLLESLSGFGAIGCLLYLLFTRSDPKSAGYRFEAFLTFGFLTGLGSGQLLRLAIAVDPRIIPTAFVSTGVIFACFTMAALLAERRSMLYLGGILMSGLNILLLMGLINIFFRSMFVFNIQIYLTLLLFIAFIPFDTQMILERFSMGDDDHVLHALDLFIDVIEVMRMLILILTKKKNKDE